MAFDFELLTDAEAIEVGLNPAAYRGAPGKSPYVDEQGYWWQYNDASEEWENTGVLSDKVAAQEALAAAERATAAAASANEATEAVNGAVDSAEAAIQTANQAVQSANEAVEAANTAVETAGAAAATASAAAESANAAAQSAAQAEADARDAITRAEAATESANAAAQTANASAELADQAAERANQAAAKTGGLQKQIVEELPSPEQMADDVIYAVKSGSPSEGDNYEEWWKIDGNAERFGGGTGGSGEQTGGGAWYSGGPFTGRDPELDSRTTVIYVEKGVRVTSSDECWNSTCKLTLTATQSFSNVKIYGETHVDYEEGGELSIQFPDSDSPYSYGSQDYGSLWYGNIEEGQSIIITCGSASVTLIIGNGNDPSWGGISPESFTVDTGDTPETGWRIEQNEGYINAPDLRVGDYYINHSTGEYFRCAEFDKTYASYWTSMGQFVDMPELPKPFNPRSISINKDHYNFTYDGQPHCPVIQYVTNGSSIPLKQGNDGDYVVYGLTPQTEIGRYEYLLVGTGRGVIGVYKDYWEIVE